MTVSGQGGPPSLSEAARQLGVAIADLNADFGVVPIDPDRQLYAVEVEAQSIDREQAEKQQTYRGPFSNPRIAPFGPPKKK